MTFPGFPCNEYNFNFEQAGPAIGGLIVRDVNGIPVPGVLPSALSLVSAGPGWSLNVAPFVASRSKGRAVLLGGTAEQIALVVPPAPAANARLDVVYAFPADVGAGDPIEAARVLSGVPGAIPAKPTIPTGAIELATYRSQAGQSSASQGIITNTFPFTVAAGGVLPVRSAAVLETLNLMNGAKAFDLATSREYTRKGGVWVRDPIIWAGAVTTPGSATAAQSSVPLEFPDGLFPSNPIVTTTPITGIPGGGDIKTSAANTTPSGTIIYCSRATNSPTTVSVVAILI